MSARDLPDARGHFDRFGGRFVPEALQAALSQLTGTFEAAVTDPDFLTELEDLRREYARRPSPLTEAPRFSQYIFQQTGHQVRVLLKREDLNHTGSHKINNVLGQALLTRKMGKRRLIAETGAGQHGVATATVAAMMGMECRIYMGQIDTERQALNVARMQLLGAEVIAVEAGSRTLKDAMNEAMRDWVAHVEDTHYLIGTASGPHPFPKLVREFQRVISAEARQQALIGLDAFPTPFVRVSVVGRMPSDRSPSSSTTPRFVSTVSRRAVTVSRSVAMQHQSPEVPLVCCTALAPTFCKIRTARRWNLTPYRPAWTIPELAPNILG